MRGRPSDGSAGSGSLGVEASIEVFRSFRMPDGTMVTSIDVDSNGRLLQLGADSSDDSPTVGEFLGQTGGMIAPFWTDINPSAGGRQ